MRGLKGKNVLVTGGASGIGQATAARFLEEGSQVCVLDRSDDARARVVKELPGLAAAIEGDVAVLDQVQAAFAQAIDCMGSVDILINNAGISIRHDFLDITPEEWVKIQSINLNGTFYMAQAAAKLVHPAISVVYEIADAEGATFISMELVRGRPQPQREQGDDHIPRYQAAKQRHDRRRRHRPVQ